jgi:hypothetical protein
MKVKVQKVQIIEEEIEVEDNFPNRRWLERIEELVENVKIEQSDVELLLRKILRGGSKVVMKEMRNGN